ncbi:hypothetical protein FO519_006834 [Halicephalobus sp. NKZ332]|nr:hypothetical protein FO519_006834 [Halicephalobus sp. NKZ332]
MILDGNGNLEEDIMTLTLIMNHVLIGEEKEGTQIPEEKTETRITDERRERDSDHRREDRDSDYRRRDRDLDYRRRDKDSDSKKPEKKDVVPEKPAKKEIDPVLTRAGGAYIPPARLKMMMEQSMDKSGEQYQRMNWDRLKKRVHGQVNKVNITNIVQVVRELLQENVIRGKGLLASSIIQAQSFSPSFTHVYAGLVSIVNSKFPNIGELILRRLVIQFKRAFRTNNKATCVTVSTFIGHLANQRVCHELLILQILVVLMENPTDDSIEIAVNLLKVCGQMLTQVTPQGTFAMFEQLRRILEECDEISSRTQYMIEVLFAVRKEKFAAYPSVIEELDLIDEEDQVCHIVNLEAAHKLIKNMLKPGVESELCHMIVDCCAQQRSYTPFYGKLAERFCKLRKEFQDTFEAIARDSYLAIHRFDLTKLRNLAMLVAHLLATDAISWEIMSVIKLTEEDTTSSGRIYIKIVFTQLYQEDITILKMKMMIEEEDITMLMKKEIDGEDDIMILTKKKMKKKIVKEDDVMTLKIRKIIIGKRDVMALMKKMMIGKTIAEDVVTLEKMKKRIIKKDDVMTLVKTIVEGKNVMILKVKKTKEKIVEEEDVTNLTKKMVVERKSVMALMKKMIKKIITESVTILMKKMIGKIVTESVTILTKKMIVGRKSVMSLMKKMIGKIIAESVTILTKKMIVGRKSVTTLTMKRIEKAIGEEDMTLMRKMMIKEAVVIELKRKRKTNDVDIAKMVTKTSQAKRRVGMILIEKNLDDLQKKESDQWMEGSIRGCDNSGSKVEEIVDVLSDYTNEDDYFDSDEDYDGFCDDDDPFDGFLTDNAPPPMDLIQEEIINLLRIGMDRRNTNEVAHDLIQLCKRNGSEQQLGKSICDFIIACSPSNVEFVQRLGSVRAVLSAWDDSKKYMISALNDVLDPENQMNTIPGRNMTYFIRCLVEEGFIDPQALDIFTTPSSCLSEKDNSRLQQVLYKRYNVPKSGSWSSALASLTAVGDIFGNPGSLFASGTNHSDKSKKDESTADLEDSKVPNDP